MNTIDTSRMDFDLRRQLNADEQGPAAPTISDHSSSASQEGIDVDRLFLNNMRPQQATDFLAQHINRRLGKQFAIQPLQTPAFVQNYDNTAATANRILQMANHAFHKISGEQGISAAASKVRNQIDQGYNEAMQNFSVFGKLAPETQDSLSAVRELLDNAYQHAPLNGDVEQTQNLFAQAHSVSSSLNSSLSIETAEGDVITIELSHSLSQTTSTIRGDNGRHQLNIAQRENSENFELNINVEGNLNEEEKAAVAQLVQQLSQVEQQQNLGHEQAAQQQADSLVYDRSIISAFNFSQQEVTTEKTVELTSNQPARLTSESTTPAETNILQEIEDKYQQLPVKNLHQTVIAIMKRLQEFRELLDNSVSKATENQPAVQA